MTRLSFVNPELLAIAEHAMRQHKHAFVDPTGMSGGDPAAAGGAPPGGDPAAMGGDPAAMGGMPPGGDPAAMGAAPPPPAPAGGDPSTIAAAVVQALQQAGMGGAGGAGGAAGGGIKPKIDVNVEIMQMKHMIAKLIDALGVPVSAQEMTATPDKLQQMAGAQQAGGSTDPSAAGGAASGGSSIAPIAPIQGASPALASGTPKQASRIDMGTPSNVGHAPIKNDMSSLTDKAAAISRFLAAFNSQ